MKAAKPHAHANAGACMLILARSCMSSHGHAGSLADERARTETRTVARLHARERARVHGAQG